MDNGAAKTNSPSQPLRVLGPFDATCVVIGAIIGVGIFFTPSRIAGLTGSEGLALTAWGLAGLIAMCGALTFAELGRRYTGNGAQYEVLRDSYGPLTAFLFVFCNATAIQGGAIAIIAIVCVENLALAVGAGSVADWLLAPCASVVIVVLSVANVIGARWGAGIQGVTVAAKLLTLLAITVLAVVVGQRTGAEVPHAATMKPLGPVAGVLAALVPAFFAFGGWQQALWLSGEVKDPQRNLPRAIIVGVSIVTLVYLLANWAYLRLLGVEGVAASTTLAADAVGVAAPGWGRRAISAAVGVSAFGVLNSQLLSGPRLVYGMARDGRFFDGFGRLSPRLGTPIAAVLLLQAMALALLVIADKNGIDYLLTGVMFVDAVFFILTGAALFILRRRASGNQAAGGLSRLKAPLYPFAPLIFVVGFMGVAAGAYVDPGVRRAAFIGVAWIAAAAIVYVLWFRKPVHGRT